MSTRGLTGEHSGGAAGIKGGTQQLSSNRCRTGQVEPQVEPCGPAAAFTKASRGERVSLYRVSWGGMGVLAARLILVPKPADPLSQ